jgi:hypothetical protein
MNTDPALVFSGMIESGVTSSFSMSASTLTNAIIAQAKLYLTRNTCCDIPITIGGGIGYTKYVIDYPEETYIFPTFRQSTCLSPKPQNPIFLQAGVINLISSRLSAAHSLLVAPASTTSYRRTSGGTGNNPLGIFIIEGEIDGCIIEDAADDSEDPKYDAEDVPYVVLGFRTLGASVSRVRLKVPFLDFLLESSQAKALSLVKLFLFQVDPLEFRTVEVVQGVKGSQGVSRGS